jgi:hypothetical protein
MKTRKPTAPKPRNPIARELRSRRFAQRIVRSRMLYTRKDRRAAPGAEAG